MNGPFQVCDYGSRVIDADAKTVASGEGDNEEAERKNAEMVCAALNAVYFIQQAAGDAS